MRSLQGLNVRDIFPEVVDKFFPLLFNLPALVLTGAQAQGSLNKHANAGKPQQDVSQ